MISSVRRTSRSQERDVGALKVRVESVSAKQTLPPDVVFAVSATAVIVGGLIAAAEATTVIVALATSNGRVPEALVPVRIGCHSAANIAPRGIDSVMESLASYTVVIWRWLLPSQVDVNLSVCLRHRYRRNGDPCHQHGAREHGECGFCLLHSPAFP